MHSYPHSWAAARGADPIGFSLAELKPGNNVASRHSLYDVGGDQIVRLIGAEFADSALRGPSGQLPPPTLENLATIFDPIVEMAQKQQLRLPWFQAVAGRRHWLDEVHPIPNDVLGGASIYLRTEKIQAARGLLKALSAGEIAAADVDVLGTNAVTYLDGALAEGAVFARDATLRQIALGTGGAGTGYYYLDLHPENGPSLDQDACGHLESAAQFANNLAQEVGWYEAESKGQLPATRERLGVTLARLQRHPAAQHWATNAQRELGAKPKT